MGREDGVGKHEPPSGRSFYFSLATSTLRALIIVAAIVLGVVVLANAFPSGGGTIDTPPPVSIGTSPSPSVSPTKPSPKAPSIQGAVLQVLNGTTVTGLAATAATELKDAGATIPAENVANAAGAYPVTTLFYRPDSKALAQTLRDRFYPGAQLKPATNDLKPDVRVTVIVGDDYARSHEG